jgi:LacI family transcriptional regulator
MRAAHERGLQIPRDISIAGFDDSLVARQLWPALTTIRQPVPDMSGAATQLLLDLLNGRDIPINEMSMKTDLIIRDSTGPVSSQITP